MLICAQSGRVTGLERKTGPASGARSSMKGFKDNNNQFLGIVNKFCIPFGTENTMSICGGRDIDCFIVTPIRVAKFRVKYLNSDVERTSRGIILLVLLFKQLVLKFLSRFSVN